MKNKAHRAPLFFYLTGMLRLEVPNLKKKKDNEKTPPDISARKGF